MKKNFKRWLALVLAVLLVSGTCLTHTDSFLWATDGETTEATNENVQTVAEGTGETAEQQTVEQQPVEEKQEVVIPKKEEESAPAEQEKKEEPKVEESANKEPSKAEEPAKETQPENKTEANQTVQGTKPAGGQEVEVVPSDKKENFYNVVFYKPAVDGGTLYVWEDGKRKQEASYINEKFTKEVKEGTTLYFEIKTADNYSVEKVTDKLGRVMTPEKTTENTSTYKMVVKEKNEITIIYKEVKVEEPKTEEQPKEEPQVEEPQKNEATETPTEGDEVQDPVTEEAPGAGDENRISTFAAQQADYTIKVGESLTINGKSGIGHEWSIASGEQGIVKLSNTSDRNVTVQGVKAGTVTLKHARFFLDAEYFTVEVESVTEPQVPEGTERVYLYMKMSRVPDGWNINKDGWYTIGYVDVQGIPSATKYSINTYENEYREKVIEAIANGNGVVRYTNHANLELDFSKIQWAANGGYGLKVAQGATDYNQETGGQNTWHLDGYLEVRKTGVVKITGNSDTVTYDGTEKTVSGFQVVEKPADVTVSLKDSQKATVKAIDVGTYPMGLIGNDFRITGGDYDAIDVQVTDGYLKIDPNNEKQIVTINGNTATVDYDGTEKTVSGYTVTSAAGIDVSLKAGVKAEAKGINADTYQMGLTPESFNVTSTNYTNIEVKVNDGWLKINPNSTEVNVTVTGNTKTVDYNGQEQEVTGFTTNAPEGVTVSLKDTKVARAAGTDAGTYHMNLTKEDFTVSSQNYSNVKIVKVIDGWLKIDKSKELVTVKVKGHTDTVTYNGQEQEVTGFDTNAPDDITVTLADGSVARAAGTNAQEAPYKMGLTASDFVATSKNHENIQIVVEQDGWLKINPKTEELVVNVTGNTDTVKYTGHEQTVTGFEHDATDSSVTITLKEGKQAVARGINAKEQPYPMGLTEEDFTATSPNYTKIKVHVTDGWLKIEPTNDELVVNVQGKTATKNYTGSLQYVEGFDVLDAPDSVTVALAAEKTARAEGTNADTYAMGLSAQDFTATSPNYTNIKINVTDGWLKIEPQDTLIVEVKGKNDTVTYNGKEQKVEGFTSNAPTDVKVELKTGSKAEAKGINAGTYYMNLTPEDFTATSKNYKNITISIQQDGFLEINPITTETVVNINGNTDTKRYTGKEQTVEGFTSNAKNIDQTIQVTLANGSKAEAKGTVVGTYPMNLTENDFVLSSPNYTNLKANVTDGWLKINPTDEKLTVKITGANASEEYTGSEQSITGFTHDATDDSVTVALKKGKEAVAKGTVVGHYSMGLTKDSFEVTSDNYNNIEVEVVDGYLDITPTSEKLTVKIIGANASKEYTGSEQSVTGFTSDAPEDVTVELKKGSTAEAKGTNADIYYMNLKSEDFTATSKNYKDIMISIEEDGFLEITPITAETVVEIEGNTDTKDYVGTEQKVEGFTSNAETIDNTIQVALADGSKAEAKGTDAQEEPYYMGLSAENFVLSSPNYTNLKAKVTDGWLKIDPTDELLTVTITGNHASEVYTGVEQSVTGFKSDAPANVSVKLADGKEAVAKGIVVGRYQMGLTKDSFEVTSDNYSNIEVEVVDGYLDITPITEKLTVKITGNHDSKVYTGSEQSVTGFKSDAPANVSVKLVDREEAVAKGTVVDRYQMGLTEDSFEVTSDNYSNIEVVVVDGYLDITPITETLKVTITGNHASKVYTGVEQSVTDFESNAPANVSVKLVDGKEAVAKGIVVGHYPMGLTEDSFEVTSANYRNIEVVVVDGYLDITPITEKLTVTITGKNKTETYNGEPWTVTGFDHDAPANVSVKLVDEAKAEVTKTEAGRYPMGLTEESFEVTSDNYSDIEVVVVDGYLLINPADTLTVHVKGTQEDKVYNGREQVVTGFTEDAPDDVEITLKEGIKAEAKGTVVDKYPMNLDKEDFEVKANNYSKIDLVVEDGWLNITPVMEEVTVKVIGNHDSKVYNGTEQSVTGFTSNAEKIDKTIKVELAEGSKAEAKGTVVSDQPYKMGLKETDFTATSKNYSNLKVDVTDGYLEITPNTEEVVVEVTGNHDSKPYNGQEQKVTGFTSNAEKIDKTIEVKLAEGSKAEAKGIVVSDQPYKMGLKKTDFIATSKNYANLKVKVTDGYLTITPIEAAITLTADSDEKVYDGTALTQDTFTSDGNNILVSGDTITAVVEGSRTDAGTADNVITSHRVVRTIGEKTVDVTNCYNFKPYEKGLLEVTKRPITVEAKSQAKIFDNIPLVNKGHELTAGTLASTQSEVVTVEGSQLYVGSSLNKVKEVKIYTSKMEDVTSNYEITLVDGTLTVTDGGETPVDPNKVVTKTHDENKTYTLGDTIEFTIKVTNIYAEPKTITIVEQEGVTITGESVFENVAPGAVVTTTAEYVVTEQDILAGSFTNHVTAKFEGGKDFDNTDEVTKLEDKDGHLVVAKETTSKPANGTTYVLGEKITYKITVTNDGNLTISDIVVNDDLTGDKWTIETLAPGEFREFTAEYVVTEADLLNGSVTNVATANGTSPDPNKPEVPVTPGEKEEPTAAAKPKLFVEKTAELKENGEAFELGDTINYTIKVLNSGNLTIKDIDVNDDLTKGNWTVDSLAPGASEKFTTTYTVTEADLVNGKILNEATANGKADDPNATEVVASANETVSTVKAASHITINKKTTSTPKDEKGYALGEAIKYEITVTNDGNQTLKNVVVTDDLTGDKWTIETLAPGAIETFTAEYKVTADDIVTGSVQNVATATADKENPGSPEPEVTPGTTDDKTEDEKPALTSTKTLTNEGSGTDGKFKAGDTAEFDITVKNTGNVTLNNVKVAEQLNGAKIVNGEGYKVNADGTVATIDTLNVGKTVVVKATYVVTQADVDNGGAVNSVTVGGEGSGTTDPDPDKPEEPIPTEPQKPDFTSKKKLMNKGTGFFGKFKVGETAAFDITVQNTGNVTLNDITVTEQLKGAVILAGDGYKVVDGVAVIDTLEVGATVVVKAEYVITQADVDNGGVENVVAVEGEGSGEENPDPENPKEEIPTDDKNPTAITAKTLTNAGSGEGGSFKVGETAEFDITVQNTGNVTLKDVVVKEMLNGAKIVAGEGYTVNADGKSATIAAIKVGETATVKAVYTITQADVDNGQVINTADVEVPGKPDPQNPEEPIPTDPEKPDFTSTKTLANEGTGADGKFKVGDTAEFDITVQNTGNVTLNDVTVKEQLAGAKIIAGEGYRVGFDGTAIIDTLEVGKTVVVKATYTITQADVDDGGVVNSVAVEGKGPDGENPTPENPEEPIPTEDPNPSMSVAKTVTSENDVYNVGDTITYQIVVKNDGNITLHDVVVTDTLQNAAGEVTFEATEGVTFDGNIATIESMVPGETVTLNCSYVVTREDAGNDIINTAVGDSDETDPSDPSTTDPSDVENMYNLTINYVYADGRTAAPSVRAQYLAGEAFGYASPTIDGYTPDYAFVRTGAEGMPARDVEVTVVYTAVAVPTPTPTPDTPTTPTTPDAGTTTPDAGATTPAAAEPEEAVGAEITTNEEGEVEVVPVIEEEVPLANRDLDDHECCILHFLLMLAAMIVYAAYTRSMKKRQERIAELADELETEMLKRRQQESAE